MGADGNIETIRSGVGINGMEISGTEINELGISETGRNQTAGETRLTEDELVQLISTAGEGTIISIDLAEGEQT